jgi:hypothetical protein
MSSATVNYGISKEDTNLSLIQSNQIITNNLKNGKYTFPATDGTAGQVLSTNGHGVLSWVAH